ncbi:hypothetical protein [Actinokineospora sp.]|uniref:hypothetical protein n=1 Tax=Actinokineospora sp. TaxID=1872133 RepID=UPI00403840BD
MLSAKPRVLYVTDLAYPAAGRRYGDEDIALAGRLRDEFTVVLCHPLDALAVMDGFDVTVVRNSGPVVHYREGYELFRAHALAGGHKVFNELTGSADMVGKRYLVDLCRAGYPVIPTVDDPADLGRLPVVAEYVVKPKFGSDSIGLTMVARNHLAATSLVDMLVQPRVDFEYEVSFYFVDDSFQYALYAPDPGHRWRLVPYRPSAADLGFARRFVEWNGIRHGIQRIDACRTRQGELLLVEVEDLNPFLSLEVLDGDTRARFERAVADALHRLLREGAG